MKRNVEIGVHNEGHGCQVAGREYGRSTMDVLIDTRQRLSVELTNSVLDLIGQVGFIWVISKDGDSSEVIRRGSTGGDGVKGVSRVPEI